MAANLDNVMTWEEACKKFETVHLPVIKDVYEQDGEPDWPARRESWNNFTDFLCKSGRISDWQYENWSHPACCGQEVEYERRLRRIRRFSRYGVRPRDGTSIVRTASASAQFVRIKVDYMSFIKLDDKIGKKDFFTVSVDSITDMGSYHIISLEDSEGRHFIELSVFKEEEDAGQIARDYWEELIRDDKEHAVEVLGADTLIAWALGEEAGPGTSKVKSLNEWLDLYLESPDEHYDIGPFHIEAIGENIVEYLGYKPAIAYGM